MQNNLFQFLHFHLCTQQQTISFHFSRNLLSILHNNILQQATKGNRKQLNNMRGGRFAGGKYKKLQTAYIVLESLAKRDEC